MVSLNIQIPHRWSINHRIGKHQVRQIMVAGHKYSGEVEVVQVGRSSSALKLQDGTYIVNHARHAPANESAYLICRSSLSNIPDGTLIVERDLRWRTHDDSLEHTPASISTVRDEVLSQWTGQFQIRRESETTSGLRTPQVGALHALLAHWTVSQSAATVILPTGTGKTETMIAALVHERLSPLLVVVPSQNLRHQLTEKLLTLGVLPAAGVVPIDIARPVVGTLAGRVNTVEEAQQILRSCNVIVSTVASFQMASEQVRDEFANNVPHLFVDEAHHVPAITWTKFCAAFEPRKIVQFTATPFRGDKRLVPGKVVYRFPLKRAQEEGYFERISLRHVFEYDPESADIEIASKAIESLETDLEHGLDHVLMARAATIARAEALAQLYEGMTHLGVGLMHSALSPSQKREEFGRLNSREVRVVVCVDMLGEGYDLPALKVAALHDAHRGLGITLQFIGRFTRTAENIGPATVIANLADFRITDELQELYSQDSDWNTVLEELAEGAAGRYQRRIEFAEGFDNLDGEIPLQNVRPKLSAEIYRVTANEWNPERLFDSQVGDRLYFQAINLSENVAVAVLRRSSQVPWGEVATLRDLTHDLIVLYFDPGRQILYLYSSDTAKYHQDIVDAVTDFTASRIQGNEVFRVLAGINRLLVANLGLKHAIGRSVYFTMYAGLNVHDGLTEQNFINRMTSNLFGFGFENGERASAGCSYKGRVWSYKIAEDLGEWVDWCKKVGQKITDSRIDPQQFLRTTMRTAVITERPAGKYPISAEWDESVWYANEERISFFFGTDRVSLLDVSIDVVDPSMDQPLLLGIRWEERLGVYAIELSQDEVGYVHHSGEVLGFELGRSRLTLEQWLSANPPTIRFHDGSQLVGKILVSATSTSRPFLDDDIEVWGWDGVDLTQESQRVERRPRSIQRRVFEVLEARGYSILFDDDGSGESADIVAISATEDLITVHLFHLKFVHGGSPRTQVEDLYQVCGQAQKSVHWKADRFRLIEHLLQRDSRRRKSGLASRFERGDQDALRNIGQLMRYLDVKFEIFIVQPGVRKSALSDEQRDLLASTQLYLSETYAVPFRLISSE